MTTQHHSDNPSQTHENFKRIMEELDSSFKDQLGATGRFPEGTITANDEGELQFGITNYGGKVMLNFGKPVAWLGLDPQHAVELANLLIRHAREANRVIGRERSTKPLTVKL